MLIYGRRQLPGIVERRLPRSGPAAACARGHRARADPRGRVRHARPGRYPVRNRRRLRGRDARAARAGARRRAAAEALETAGRITAHGRAGLPGRHPRVDRSAARHLQPLEPCRRSLQDAAERRSPSAPRASSTSSAAPRACAPSCNSSRRLRICSSAERVPMRGPSWRRRARMGWRVTVVDHRPAYADARAISRAQRHARRCRARSLEAVDLESLPCGRRDEPPPGFGRRVLARARARGSAGLRRAARAGGAAASHRRRARTAC